MGRSEIHIGRRRILKRALVALGILCVGALGGGALHTVLAPSTVQEPAEPPSATAEEGTIGSSLRLNVRAEWASTLVLYGQAEGVITRVTANSDQLVSQGDVIYYVDEQPVTALKGNVPFFRDIQVGDSGEDVQQVRQFLLSQGLTRVQDGDIMTAELLAAFNRWRSTNGFGTKTSISRADFIAFPELPSRFQFSADSVVVGSSLSAGSPVLDILSSSPRFLLSISEQQALTIPANALVSITSPAGNVWDARLSDRRTSNQEEQTLEIELAGVNDTSVCAKSCTEVPVGEPTLLASEVEIVPETDGVVIPSSALRTDSSGKVVVEFASGGLAEVEVLASTQGQSVVTGIQPGQQVILKLGGRVEE